MKNITAAKKKQKLERERYRNSKKDRKRMGKGEIRIERGQEEQ